MFDGIDNIYNLLNTPHIEKEVFNYIKHEINNSYNNNIKYFLLFENGNFKIIADCIWGNMPLIEGSIFKFYIKINTDDIAIEINKSKQLSTKLFGNIQCKLIIKNNNQKIDDINKIKDFFKNGQNSFLMEGFKDYYLLISEAARNNFYYFSDFFDDSIYIIKLNILSILNKFNFPLKKKENNFLIRRIKDYMTSINQNNKIYNHLYDLYSKLFNDIKKNNNKHKINIKFKKEEEEEDEDNYNFKKEKVEEEENKFEKEKEDYILKKQKKENIKIKTENQCNIKIKDVNYNCIINNLELNNKEINNHIENINNIIKNIEYEEYLNKKGFYDTSSSEEETSLFKTEDIFNENEE